MLFWLWTRVDQRKHIPGGEPDPQGKGQYFVVVFPMKCVRLNASLAANAAVGVADLCTGDSMSANMQLQNGRTRLSCDNYGV